jgi:hypothetical protein
MPKLQRHIFSRLYLHVKTLQERALPIFFVSRDKGGFVMFCIAAHRADRKPTKSPAADRFFKKAARTTRLSR